MVDERGGSGFARGMDLPDERKGCNWRHMGVGELKIRIACRKVGVVRWRNVVGEIQGKVNKINGVSADAT